MDTPETQAKRIEKQMKTAICFHTTVWMHHIVTNETQRETDEDRFLITDNPFLCDFQRVSSLKLLVMNFYNISNNFALGIYDYLEG